MLSEGFEPGSRYKQSLEKRPWITLITTIVIALLIVSLIWFSKPGISNVTDERIEVTRKLLGPEPLDINIIYATHYRVSSYAVSVLEEKIEQYSEERIVDIHYYEIESVNGSVTSSQMSTLIYDVVGTTERAHLNVICVDGYYSTNPTAVGLNWNNYNMALFEEVMMNYLEGLAYPFSLEDYEAAIIVHEWGHAIGMVNNGYSSSFNYEDASHPHHTINPKSVMHWAVEYVGVTAKPSIDFGLQEEKDISGLKQAAGYEGTTFAQALLNSNSMLFSFAIFGLVIALGTSLVWYLWGCESHKCKTEIEYTEERGR